MGKTFIIREQKIFTIFHFAGIIFNPAESTAEAKIEEVGEEVSRFHWNRAR